MANSLLTPTAVTREILRVLHEKAMFIGTTVRSYDDSFGQEGAKIGDSLKIRLPNKYTVRSGKTLNAQDTSENSVTLTVATQKGVDMNFSSAELKMELDDFSERIIQPAVAVLISDIEYSYLSTVTKDVYNLVGTAGTTPATMLTFGQARARLNKMLAPKDGNRYVQLESDAMAAMVNAYSGLFESSKDIKQQYRDGFISRNSGFNWYENERIYYHTNGDDVAGAVDDAAGTYLTNGSSTLHIDGLGTTVTAGSVFTVANVYAVHPETKQSLGYLQQFVVTSAPTVASNEADVSISPAFYNSGALQNVDALPADNAAVTFVGSASTEYEQHLAYHKEAFAFATADLPLPEGVHFAGREVMDGISVRLIRQYDINNDNFPCRLDILHGYQSIRPELAVRITG